MPLLRDNCSRNKCFTILIAKETIAISVVPFCAINQHICLISERICKVIKRTYMIL